MTSMAGLPDGSRGAGHAANGHRPAYAHPLLRRKRFGGRYIYLYIFLRNHAGGLILTLVALLGLLSFLRPLPAFTSSASTLASPATKTNAHTTDTAAAAAGAMQGTKQARTGRQLTGTETVPASGEGSPGGAGAGEASSRKDHIRGGGQKGSTLASQAAAASGEGHQGRALSKEELLALVKRDPDAAQVRAAVMNQRFRDSVPVYGFVHFSSYRMSPVQFAALGFSAVVMRYNLRLGRCLWKEKHGGHRVMGNLTAIYPGEHHEMRYEAVVIVCHLEESTESDYGGVLLYTVDGEDIIAYLEEKGEFPVATPRPPFKYQLAFCTAPLVGQVSPRRMYEWIEYHLHMGVDRIVVYDAGAVDAEVVAMLDAYTEQDISIQIVNLRQVKSYPSWDNGRLLTTNDCMYRHRFTARWVFLAELSEYFSSETGGTLLGLLNSYEGKPYVSLGSRWWSLERCVAQDEGSWASKSARDSSVGEGMVLGSLDSGGWVWGVERMLFHWPHYYCTNKKDFPKVELCIDYHGFRRYAVDPRLVASAQIHRTEVPRLGGVDVDADVARLNRFPGLLEESPGKECTKTMKMSEVVDWWVKDHQVALLAKEAKQQPHAQFKSHVKPQRSHA